MELYERLLALRKARGMTQETMAQALFVSRQTIHKWENGKAQPDLAKFGQICELFGVSSDCLLGLGPEGLKPESFPPPNAAPYKKTAAETPETPQPPETRQTPHPPQPPEYQEAPEAIAPLGHDPVPKPWETAPQPQNPSETACARTKRRARTLRWVLIAALAVAIGLCLGIRLLCWPPPDQETEAAQSLGIVPEGMKPNAPEVSERDFLQMLASASKRQHPEPIAALEEAARHGSYESLSREKAAYWLYCTHIWTVIDPQADLSVGQNGGVDPISLRNVYEELNPMSRAYLTDEAPWEIQLCQEVRQAAALFERYDGTREMDEDIRALVDGAHYTAVVFCAAQRCYGSERPVMEVMDGLFHTKAPVTARDGIHAVYRLLGSW